MSELSPEEKLTIAAYDKHAENWSVNHADSDFWREELINFKSFLPNGKILEIGAGGGRDARELIKAGYEYLGTDISRGFIEQARKSNPGVRFEEVSVYDLKYDELFDGFWCSAVLLHIPRGKIDEALNAINRNIKRGGFGFIAIKEGEAEKIESDQKNTLEDGRFFVYWRDNDFSEILARNGYEIVDKDFRPMSERTRWLTYIVKVVNE